MEAFVFCMRTFEVSLETFVNHLDKLIKYLKSMYPSSTIYWCNIGPIYSQCLANENILGIY